MSITMWEMIDPSPQFRLIPRWNHGHSFRLIPRWIRLRLAQIYQKSYHSSGFYDMTPRYAKLAFLISPKPLILLDF